MSRIRNYVLTTVFVLVGITAVSGSVNAFETSNSVRDAIAKWKEEQNEETEAETEVIHEEEPDITAVYEDVFELEYDELEGLKGTKLPISCVLHMEDINEYVYVQYYFDNKQMSVNDVVRRIESFGAKELPEDVSEYEKDALYYKLYEDATKSYIVATTIIPEPYLLEDYYPVLYPERDSSPWQIVISDEVEVSDSVSVHVIALLEKGMQSESQMVIGKEIEESESDTHRYELVVKDVTWMEARKEAEKRGGHLVTITSKQEQEEVCEILEATRKKYIDRDDQIHVVWLGALRENEFCWINGEDFRFNNWAPGEPNREVPDEKYLDMYYDYKREDWVWNDVPNDIKEYYEGRICFIIEYD